MPSRFILPECHWYLAQQPENKWSRMMTALTSAGVGHAITRVPKRIMPLRPYVSGTQCTYMVGGGRRNIKPLRHKNPKTASEPNFNMFVTDKNEREQGDCMPDAIIAICCSLYWRYPEEFSPDYSFPHTVKAMRLWIVSKLRDKSLGLLSGRHTDDIERILQTNINEEI